MLIYLLLSGAATSASFACVCSVHDANAKISPDMPFPPTLTVPLAAARRELVHWQVAVRDGSSSTELIPTAEALGIASNITIRRVAMHELNTTFVPTHPPGRYPDALLPLSMHAPGTAFDGKFLIFSFYNMTEYFTNLMMYFVIIKIFGSCLSGLLALAQGAAQHDCWHACGGCSDREQRLQLPHLIATQSRRVRAPARLNAADGLTISWHHHINLHAKVLNLYRDNMTELFTYFCPILFSFFTAATIHTELR